jgi:membrane protein YqaA with SNARE-associated domain
MIDYKLLSQSMTLFLNIQLWGLVILYAVFGLVLNWLAYKAGKEGVNFVGDDQKIKSETWKKVSAWYERYGNGVLLLTIVPGVGNAAAAYAGVIKIHLYTFLSISMLLKIVRNWAIILVIYMPILLSQSRT